jgi:hypothetical protein
MIQIGTTLVTEDLIEKDFVCNLNACKGACCVAGEYGAPLESWEAEKLREILPKIKPYLREAGIAAIEEQGAYVTGEDGDLETPLVSGKECAYLTFNDQGQGVCGIESAYLEGTIDYHKPVSCHLYPVRVTKYTSFEAVNYHRWETHISTFSVKNLWFNERRRPFGERANFPSLLVPRGYFSRL